MHVDASPPVINLDTRGNDDSKTYDPKRKISKKMYLLRKAVGGLKGEKKDGVKFEVKSAKTLMKKFRRAMDRLQINMELKATQFVSYPVDKGTMCYGGFVVRFIAVEDGSFTDVVCVGQGADNQDKAAGKFNTYSWKYAVIYTLLLPDADVKEEYPEEDEDPEDTDDVEFPTGEPAGIKLPSIPDYIDRINKAESREALGTITNEAKAAYLGTKMAAELKKIVKPYEQRLKFIEQQEEALRLQQITQDIIASENK